MKYEKNFEIGALKIFATVAESETLTHAGERLGITQSAVSQAIKQLEVQTSSELVIRRLRPTKLTPCGEILNEYATKILADTRRVLTDIQATAKCGFQQLNLGMIDSFGEAASQQIIQQLKPFVAKISLRTGLAAPLSQALCNHDLDLLITSDPIEELTEFACLPILRDPFVMIAPESLSQHGNVTPQWLARNVPFVRYNRQNRVGMLTDLIARRLNIELMTHYELDSTQTLLRFVQSGDGWAMITGLCLIRYPELLNGVSVMPLMNGANARYISLRYRNSELGELPTKIADICRNIYSDTLVPELVNIAPWFDQHAYAITEMPLI